MSASISRERKVFVHEYVTGGGLAGSEPPASWASEGAAMRRGVAEDFASLPGTRVIMTLDARLPVEDGPWRVVRVGMGEEPGLFASEAAACDFTVVIAPETDGILRARAETIERVGGRSLGSTSSSIALAGDKLRLGRHWKALGIPTPECRAVEAADGLPRDFPYPAVLKPIEGAGSIDTFFVEAADARPAGARESPATLLQAFVTGEPLSASFLVGPGGGATPIGLARQRLQRRGGRFSYRGGTAYAFGQPALDRLGIGPDAWSMVVRAIEAVPGLSGWVGVDFVHDAASSRLSLMEINPRVTTSYVGLRRLFRAGEMARRWLDAVSLAVGDHPAWEPPLPSFPIAVEFDADGSCSDRDSPHD